MKIRVALLMFMLPLTACVSQKNDSQVTHTSTSGQLADQLDSMYAWQQIIEDVRRADARRLKQIPSLISAADASTYIKLINAMAVALPKSPDNVLLAAHAAGLTPEVCTAPGLGFDKAELDAYIAQARASLAGNQQANVAMCKDALHAVATQLQLSAE